MLRTSLISLCVAGILGSSVAYSAIPQTFTFVCPDPVSSDLGNYGDFIQGTGTESTNGITSSIMFTGNISSTGNIPADVSIYSNDSTAYAAPGVISCTYVGNGFDPFTISYRAVNVRAGRVTASSPNSITITAQVGFKK